MKILTVTLSYVILSWVMQSHYARSSETINLSNDSLLQYASSELVSKCDSALANLSGNADSATYANAEKLKVKHFKNINLGDRSLLVLILGGGGAGEIILIDSTKPNKAWFRKEINIPGMHAVIGELSDLNMDNVPELRISFSAGAHGMYASFLSIYEDSVSFIKKETGDDKFFAIRGSVQVVDIDGDGISEIKVRKTMKSGEIEEFHIFEWNGKSYGIQVKADKK